MMQKMTLAELKAYHSGSGGYFFTRGAMRFFDSRIVRSVYPGAAGWYFVTSEQFHPSEGPAHPRKFTIRYMTPDGDINTAKDEDGQGFQKYRTAADARAEIRRLIAAGK